jgi:hypothetical protein
MTKDDADINEGRSECDDSESERDGTNVDWRNVPTDPEPGSLGYATSQWERIPVTDDDQVIFLPGEEEDLADDAFVVLDERDLCDLVTRR